VEQPNIHPCVVIRIKNKLHRDKLYILKKLRCGLGTPKGRITETCSRNYSQQKGARGSYKQAIAYGVLAKRGGDSPAHLMIVTGVEIAVGVGRVFPLPRQPLPRRDPEPIVLGPQRHRSEGPVLGLQPSPAAPSSPPPPPPTSGDRRRRNPTSVVALPHGCFVSTCGEGGRKARTGGWNGGRGFIVSLLGFGGDASGGASCQ
jgi:hypothetical protein